MGTSFARVEPTSYADMLSSSTDLGNYPKSSVANPRSGYTSPQTDSVCGKPSDYTNDLRSDYNDLKNSLVSAMRKLVTLIQEESIDEGRGVLYKEGLEYLTGLYEKNKEFRDEIINFVRDKKELNLKKSLDGRCKTNKLNNSGMEFLAKCILSKDNMKDVIEILAKYYESD